MYSRSIVIWECPISTRIKCLVQRLAFMATTDDIRPRPSYQPPKTGFLSYLPASWVPYAELIRITKPCGTYYFYYPFLFGSLFAACLNPAIITPTTLLSRNFTLFLSAFMACNAACAWNDNLDKEYDRQVFRCRLRPIARGAITPLNGYIYAATLFAIWVGIIATLPKIPLEYTVPYIVCNVLYPFSKRFTYYTPACIGFTIAIGVFIGSSVLGVDVVALKAVGIGREAVAIGCLYTATGIWTIVYEGTYSFQDLTDDLKAGVMSLAVGHRDVAKQLLSTMASLQVGLLFATGTLIGAGRLYFAGACGGTVLSLAYMLWSVDLTKPEDCWWWFRDGHWFVGSSVTAGFLCEYLTRRYKSWIDVGSFLKDSEDGVHGNI